MLLVRLDLPLPIEVELDVRCCSILLVGVLVLLLLSVIKWIRLEVILICCSSILNYFVDCFIFLRVHNLIVTLTALREILIDRHHFVLVEFLALTLNCLGHWIHFLLRVNIADISLPSDALVLTVDANTTSHRWNVLILRACGPHYWAAISTNLLFSKLSGLRLIKILICIVMLTWSYTYKFTLQLILLDYVRHLIVVLHPSWMHTSTNTIINILNLSWLLVILTTPACIVGFRNYLFILLAIQLVRLSELF